MNRLRAALRWLAREITYFADLHAQAELWNYRRRNGR